MPIKRHPPEGRRDASIVPYGELQATSRARQAELLRGIEAAPLPEKLATKAQVYLWRRRNGVLLAPGVDRPGKRRECDAFGEKQPAIVAAARRLGQVMERQKSLSPQVETPLLAERLAGMKQALGPELVLMMRRAYTDIMPKADRLLRPFQTRDPLGVLMAETDGDALGTSPLKQFLAQADDMRQLIYAGEEHGSMAESRYGTTPIPSLSELPEWVRQKGWHIEIPAEEADMGLEMPLRRVLISQLLVEFADLINRDDCDREALASKATEMFKNYVHYLASGIGGNLALMQGVAKITPEDYSEAQRIKIFLYLTLAAARASEITGHLNRLLPADA